MTQTTGAANDVEFCPILLDEYLKSHALGFDLFVREENGTYTQVASHARPIDEVRLKGLQKTKARFIYIKMNDYRAFIGFHIAEIHRQAKAEEKQKQRQLVLSTSEILNSKIDTLGLPAKLWEHAKHTVEGAAVASTADPEIQNLLFSLCFKNHPLYSHSVGVALLGVAIAEQIQITNSTTLFRVALGALLHDIGLLEVPFSQCRDPKGMFDEETHAAFLQHAQSGASLLEGIKSLPSDVSSMVAQHHEMWRGGGTPGKLKGTKIHPLARIIAISERFSELAFEQKRTLAQTLHNISTDELEAFDPECVTALLKFFHFPVPAALRHKLH